MLSTEKHHATGPKNWRIQTKGQQNGGCPQLLPQHWHLKPSLRAKHQRQSGCSLRLASHWILPSNRALLGIYKRGLAGTVQNSASHHRSKMHLKCYVSCKERERDKADEMVGYFSQRIELLLRNMEWARRQRKTYKRKQGTLRCMDGISPRL